MANGFKPNGNIEWTASLELREMGYDSIWGLDPNMENTILKLETIQVDRSCGGRHTIATSPYLAL